MTTDGGQAPNLENLSENYFDVFNEILSFEMEKKILEMMTMMQTLVMATIPVAVESDLEVEPEQRTPLLTWWMLQPSIQVKKDEKLALMDARWAVRHLHQRHLWSQ